MRLSAAATGHAYGVQSCVCVPPASLTRSSDFFRTKAKIDSQSTSSLNRVGKSNIERLVHRHLNCVDPVHLHLAVRARRARSFLQAARLCFIHTAQSRILGYIFLLLQTRHTESVFLVLKLAATHTHAAFSHTIYSPFQVLSVSQPCPLRRSTAPAPVRV